MLHYDLKIFDTFEATFPSSRFHVPLVKLPNWSRKDVGLLVVGLSPIVTQGTWDYRWNALHGGLSKGF